MSRDVLDHWWSLTLDYGLIRSNPERVASARKELYADAGLSISSELLEAPLQDCLSRLEPFSPALHNGLYLATTFGWTAHFANGCRGSDPSLPMKQLSEAVATMALTACTSHETAIHPAVIPKVYDTQEAGADKWGYRRSIAAANDGGRWMFEQYGEPFPFEETEK